MSAKEAKKEYDLLKRNGDLEEMFPNMTGNWADDKKEFLKYHELNKQLFDIEVDYEEVDPTEDLY